MLECAGWAHSSAILGLKNDVDILGHEQKVREGSETVRCLLPWPAGTSRAREMVRKKSAHAKSKGWDRVGANQMLKILCDGRHVEQIDAQSASSAQYLRRQSRPQRSGGHGGVRSFKCREA